MSALLAVVASLLLAISPGIAADDPPDDGREVIDLSPDSKAGFSMRNVTAPLTSIFRGGPGYWYGDRTIDVETTPPGAFLDLFYVRANFQKRFEQAESPVRVMLPSRIDAGPRDSLTIRAFLEGYRQNSVRVPISSKQDQVVIDLEPLPNMLTALSSTYFAGRAALTFLTKESLTFRFQESKGGFSVILTETARSPEALRAIEGTRSPIIRGMSGQQLGEDLVVRVELVDAGDGTTEPRTRQAYDAARDLHGFTVELIPADGGAGAIAAAQAALADITSADVSGCALKFDSALRGQLDSGALTRALAPRGWFTDPYLRAAMRRLGELSPDGTVQFVDGSQYRPGVPIELEVALSQSAGAEGYLVLLREFVDQMEVEDYRRETLRSLIAPELDAASFNAIVDEAESSERGCAGA